MKKRLAFILSILVMTGCSSLKTVVDYDPEFNFADQKSFAVVHYNQKGDNTLLNDRLIDALNMSVKEKGYIKKDKAEADLIFVFHTNAEDKTDIDTDYQMVGYGRYGYGRHMQATTRTYRYTKGTLIIDALNPGDNKIVWRGTSTDILKSYDNPAERTRYINKVVKETMKEFPSKAMQK